MEDWRTRLTAVTRGRVVDILFDKFTVCATRLDTAEVRHLAVTLEARSYDDATSIEDYHDRILNKVNTSRQVVSGVLAPEHADQNILSGGLAIPAITPTQSDANNTNQGTPTPIHSLTKAVQSLPPELIRDSLTEMWRVMHPEYQQGTQGAETAQVLPRTIVTPADLSIPPPDLMWPLPGSEELTRKRPETVEPESDATTRIKRPKLSAKDALLTEIKEANQSLIETVAEIDEDAVNQTTIVKLTYTAVGSKNKQYTWTERLLIPENYPGCSPTLVNDIPVSKTNVCADLSHQTRSEFSGLLRTFSQPMSLKEMMETWDACAHAVMADYAKQKGGGSALGTWREMPL